MTYYSLNKMIFTIKLLTGLYVTQNGLLSSIIPMDLVVTESKNKAQLSSRQNEMKWGLC